MPSRSSLMRSVLDAVVLAAAFVGGIMANSLYRADFMMMNMKIQCNVISEAYAHGVEKLFDWYRESLEATSPSPQRL